MNGCSQPPGPQHTVPAESGRQPVLNDSLEPMDRHRARHQRSEQVQAWQEVRNQVNGSVDCGVGVRVSVVNRD